MAKHPNPTTIRPPERTRALLAAIKAKTGFTVSQIIVNAVEEYARKLGIKV